MTVMINVDLFELSDYDRDFVMKLTDQVRKYAVEAHHDELVCFNGLVANVLARCVDQFREVLPGFGDTVAVDATDVKAWANGLHQETDPDAGTGAKHKSSRRVYWYGYKVHLISGANWELPISFTVSPANVYDGAHLPSVLMAAKDQHDWFKPTHVLADKGYDSKECFRFVGEDLQAIPVIDVQKRRIGRAKEGEAESWRPCEAYPEITPNGVRYRCERLPYGPKCPRFGQCPLLPVFVHSPLNPATKVTYYERHSPFPYDC